MPRPHTQGQGAKPPTHKTGVELKAWLKLHGRRASTVDAATMDTPETVKRAILDLHGIDDATWRQAGGSGAVGR